MLETQAIQTTIMLLQPLIDYAVIWISTTRAQLDVNPQHTRMTPSENIVQIGNE